MSEWNVIDQHPDEDGETAIYGEGLTRQEAERLVEEIERCDDGRIPLLYDYIP